MREYDVIVISQCTNYPRWVPIQNVTLNTWIKGNTNDRVKILCYYPSLDVLEGHSFEDESILYYGINEKEKWKRGIDPRNERFISALEYVYNNYDFKFLKRTNGTSYIDTVRLYNILMNESPTKKQYFGAKNGRWAGLINNYKFNGNHYYVASEGDEIIYFVSGFDAIFSKDTVEYLVKNKDEFMKYDAPEDLTTGCVLKDFINIDEQYPHNNYIWMIDYCKNNNEDILLNIRNDEKIFNYKFELESPECMYDFHNKINTKKFI